MSRFTVIEVNSSGVRVYRIAGELGHEQQEEPLLLVKRGKVTPIVLDAIADVVTREVATDLGLDLRAGERD